ncbi:sugar kinase [Massilia sp. ST3]|uniref:sugar kinase n=1 Tax=Massilia sp. ST3 TaxID=2824903 RepID=UPI001B8120EB|nr:sugar kinase [Massilia sp. ST3]MBQ5946743.1 sugar kinase [Massilia sp. ST3]
MSAPLPGRIVCFGEMLLRLSPPAGRLLAQASTLDLCTGGAEANVAVSLARLGHATAMVTTLPDSAPGQIAVDALRTHGVDVGGVRREPGRMGLYFLTPGAVLRPSEIVYDRAGSSFACADPAGYDWNALLAGAAWLHVSGISPAVGAAPARAVAEAMRSARALGVRVSFDGNYRASLWAARGEDGAGVLRALMARADLAFANGRDFALLLGRPELAQPEREDEAVAAAFAAFPHLGHIAFTRRRELSVQQHELRACLRTRDASGGAAEAGPYHLHEIVDRIGTGDAFAAGILDGLLRGEGPAAVAGFGLAAAVAKHSIAGDFNLASREQIAMVAAGALSVRR